MSSEIKIRHVDREDVAETFADGVRYVTFTNGVVRVELTVTRMDDPQPPKPPVLRSFTAGRWALTASSALQLHQNLGALLAMLEQQGAIQRTAVVPPQVPPSATPPKH